MKMRSYNLGSRDVSFFLSHWITILAVVSMDLSDGRIMVSSSYDVESMLMKTKSRVRRVSNLVTNDIDRSIDRVESLQVKTLHRKYGVTQCGYSLPSAVVCVANCNNYYKSESASVLP